MPTTNRFQTQSNLLVIFTIQPIKHFNMAIIIILVTLVCQTIIVQGQGDDSKLEDTPILSSPFPIQNNEGCACPFIYSPICASDGETYPNSCVLNCARKYENPFVLGLCKGECPCCKEPYKNEPIEFEPFTAPSGWGDSSLSLFELPIPNPNGGEGNIKDKAAVPNCICTDDYTPVCGNDGNTYSNQCQLDCAAKTNSNLKTVCKQKCPCECVCDCPN